MRLEQLGDLRGSWSGTSRQLTFAEARDGRTVFEPSPVKPPQMPFGSSVGRAQSRSSVVYPASPWSVGAPVSARNAASSNGSRANSAFSSVVDRPDVVVEAGDRRSVPSSSLSAARIFASDLDRVGDGAAVASRSGGRAPARRRRSGSRRGRGGRSRARAGRARRGRCRRSRRRRRRAARGWRGGTPRGCGCRSPPRPRSAP